MPESPQPTTPYCLLDKSVITNGSVLDSVEKENSVFDST
jgi:hypothetical protein